VKNFPAVFSCIGHLYIHFFTAFYFVIVLSLEEAWQLPYPELIELWALGSLLVGLVALPAGVLGDRIGARFMMVLFFVGMGGASVLCGLSATPTSLMAALAGVGAFAAIYHPVGIPWLVRNTRTSRGKVLGLNGVFGAIGSALAGLVAGALVDLAGWRAAFIVPGVVSILTGAALSFFWMMGRVEEAAARAPSSTPASASDSRRVFAILLVTMFLAGLIYHTTQTSLPKFFLERREGLVGEGAFGVGVLVAIVYGASGALQVLGGHLADRLPLKLVYVGAIFAQVPALWLASRLGGLALVVVATAMVMANVSALPAENLLLARYTPEHRHGLVFGLKFVLSFGAAPVAVGLVAFVTGRSGGLSSVYVLLSGIAALAFVFAVFLPKERVVSG